MTWSEIKRAVEDAGIADEDEVSVIQCQAHDGDKTLHKLKLGKFVKLVIAAISTATGAKRDGSRHFLVALSSAVFILVFGVSTTVHAQQTIFNVPSSDVLDRGKVYFELDVTFKPNKDSDNVVPRFSSFVPRIVVGTGGRVEVGLNINGNVQPGPDATTLVPAIKWKAYDGGDNGWAFVVGDHVFIPVHNRSYDVGNYVYAQVSKTFKSKTRLTAGVHDFSPDVVHPKNRAGGQFGFEQPIGSKFGLAADWFTHKSSTGYVTAGVNFKPHPKVTGYAAYSIGNENVTRGNHFFYVALGINFN